VTQQTRDEAIGVIRTRLSATDIEEYTVRQGRDDTGFVLVIEVPGEDAEEIEALVGDRGIVRIDIYHQTDGEYMTVDGALTRADLRTVGAATQSDQAGPHVPVTVRPSAAKRFRQELVDTAVAQEGGSQCTYDQSPQSIEPCLQLVDDSEIINTFRMAPGLAASIQSGDWVEDPSFILTTSSLEAAQTVSISLRSGSLPAPVELSTSDELPVDESTLEDREVDAESAADGPELAADDDSSSVDVETPGFGIGAAVAGVGAAGALMRRLSSPDRSLSFKYCAVGVEERSTVGEPGAEFEPELRTCSLRSQNLSMIFKSLSEPFSDSRCC